MSSTPLSKPPSQALMLEIIARYWRKKDRLSVQFENYASYFDNYRSTCQGLFIGLNNEAKAISIQTHEEMIEIVDLIWNLVGTGTRSCCRPAIRSILPNGNTTDPTLVAKSNNSINLVLRLWLHVEIQDPRFLAGSKTIMWNDESELKDFMRDQFKAPILTATGDSWNDILDNRFKAVNLYRFCGVRFCWTSNLLEHLHFDKELRIITVFSMKQCLQDQLDCGIEITPNTVLREAILTLELLFPVLDPQTQAFLLKERQRMPFVDTPSRSRQMYLSDFYFWRDHLKEIYFEFQSPVPGWRQLVRDRRNPYQYYTFIFAVAVLALTVLFGAISTVTSLLQTRYSYESLLLARAAAKMPQCMCAMS